MNNIYTDCRSLFKFLVEINATATVMLHLVDSSQLDADSLSSVKDYVHISKSSTNEYVDLSETTMTVNLMIQDLSVVDLSGDSFDSRKRIMCKLIVVIHSDKIKKLDISNNFLRSVVFTISQSNECKFNNINILDARINPIEILDVSVLTNLEELYLSETDSGTELNLSTNSSLNVLDLRNVFFDPIIYPKESQLNSLTIHGLDQDSKRDVLKDRCKTPTPYLETTGVTRNRLMNFCEADLLHMHWVKYIDICRLNIPVLTMDLDKMPLLEDIVMTHNSMTKLRIVSSRNDVNKNENSKTLCCLQRLILNSNELENVDWVLMNKMYIHTLDLSTNLIKGTLDLSEFHSLEYLFFNSQAIEQLILTANPMNGGVIKLDGSRNNLQKIDVSNHPNIKDIDLSENKITSLDISNHHCIETIILRSNNIESFDDIKLLRRNKSLVHLDVSDNMITNQISLNLNDFENLHYINVSDIKGDNSFTLHVSSKNLKHLIVENTSVNDIIVDDNQSHNITPKIPEQIVVKNNKKLQKIVFPQILTGTINVFDISDNPALYRIDIPTDRICVKSLNIAGLGDIKIMMQTHHESALSDKLFMNICVTKGFERSHDLLLLIDATELNDLNISRSCRSILSTKNSELDLTWLNKIQSIKTITLKGYSELSITYPGDYSIKSIQYAYNVCVDKIKTNYDFDLQIRIDDRCVINTKYSGLPGGTGSRSHIHKGYGISFLPVIGILMTCIVSLLFLVSYLLSKT